jgi:hypothetical protein
MSISGVGVVDTSSLWAASSLVYHSNVTDVDADGFLRIHPSRQLYSDKRTYLLSLLHNLILYDELRTDIDVLSRESDWYSAPVRQLLDHLSSAIRIDSIPLLDDQTIVEEIAPIFIEKTGSELRSGHASAVSARIASTVLHSAHDPPAATPTPLGSRTSMTPGVVDALMQFAKGDLGIGLNRIEDDTAKLSAIVRNLSILARTVRYAAHSRFVYTDEKRPSAFCASPRRIELLQDYFDAEYVKTLQGNATEFVSLFSKLGLPKTGYDFSVFSTRITPVSLSDLSTSLRGVEPQEALDRVLKLRDTTEAKEVRRIWAERLWSGGAHALEGSGGPSVRMENVHAGRDAIQIVIGKETSAALNSLEALDRTASTKAEEDMRRWTKAALERS